MADLDFDATVCYHFGSGYMTSAGSLTVIGAVTMLHQETQKIQRRLALN